MSWLTRELSPLACRYQIVSDSAMWLLPYISIEQKDKWHSRGDERGFILQSYLDKVKRDPGFFMRDENVQKY